MKKEANRLINETSPYLLQHAYNPVQWYPWSSEALKLAKEKDKPILVSIGYSACHWCHVMEHESFENEQTAAYMNSHFINIKIDREERPDLDHIYMDAVQAMTGSGGWPLNVFLTPDCKPFYGGTYYPPQRAFNRPSWMELLQNIQQAFDTKRRQIEEQAENMTSHLRQSNLFGIQSPGELPDMHNGRKDCDEIFQNIMKQADREWGGFGRAPKFPQTMVIKYLLRYHHFTKNPEALQQALLSLDKMIDGGIYDHLRGGFARYSTDTEWLAPHFEKMLYDNALLVGVLCEAYQLTGKEKYSQVIDETMAFVQAELLHADGGFYAALDADSEGEEGRYYVWGHEEVLNILGDEATLFCAYYDIAPQGNWEHKNILRTLEQANKFAVKHNLLESELELLLEKGRKKLLAARENRVKPGLDDKIILGWNALMNEACSKAYEATGQKAYKELAEKNMAFLWKHLQTGAAFYHTWKNEQAKYPAFLDDYAYIISAMIRLQQIGGGNEWLKRAIVLTDYVITHFSDEDDLYFYYTGSQQQDVIVRKKEVYDGATPSGNAVMAANMLQLSFYTDKPLWRQRSQRMTDGLNKAIVSYPASFAEWACVLLQWEWPLLEIAIVGGKDKQYLPQVLQGYHPHKVIMTGKQSDENWPLLAGRGKENETLFYLCQNFACQKPVSTVGELLYLMSP